MTPEQSAAFIIGQAAMMQLELAALRAKHQSLSLDKFGNFLGVVDMTPADELEFLRQRYEHVLGHNAILSTFQHANAYAQR